MNKVKNAVSMGELATTMTEENWQKAPETIMAFLLAKIKLSGQLAEYISVLSENRFLYDEMIIISAEIDEIAEMRLKTSTMTALKSWRTGAKKQLRCMERETLDLRRVCQYFLYTYVQAGGKKHELLPKFMAYTYSRI